MGKGLNDKGNADTACTLAFAGISIKCTSELTKGVLTSPISGQRHKTLRATKTAIKIDTGVRRCQEMEC